MAEEFRKLAFLCLVFSLPSIFGLKRGDTCITKSNELGTCKNLNECDYAINLLTIDEKKPTNCFWDGDMRVVCCPAKKTIFGTGVFRDYFETTSNGILRSHQMTCRYDGKAPIICCGNKVNLPPDPEPEGCPKLILPHNFKKDIAWAKCLEYQRHIKMCVSSEQNPDLYVRRDTCDMSNSTIRIFGGIEANRREFPHMALLGVRNLVNTGSRHIVWVGGGTLISDRFVLTAAHLMLHRDHGRVEYVMLGVTNKTEAIDGFLYNVVNWYPYKYYKKEEKNYDIALLELDRRVQFTEFMYPACLPVPGVDNQRNFIVAGWGQTETASESDVLLKTYVTQEVSDVKCKNITRKDFIWDPDAMICGAEDKMDSCHGDSGGPLLALSKSMDCTYVVMGVVSWGSGCGKSPGIYTRVEFYRNWIIEKIWNS